jgi:hypothetical protein
LHAGLERPLLFCLASAAATYDIKVQRSPAAAVSDSESTSRYRSMPHGEMPAVAVATQAVLLDVCEPCCNAEAVYVAEDRTKRVKCLGR